MLPRIQRNALILLLLLGVGSAVVQGGAMALSVLLGGVLGILNFRWMAAGVDQLIYRGSGKGVGVTVAKFLGRLLLIFLAFFAIIHSSFLSLWGALLGLSVFVLAAMLEAVLLMFKVR